MHQSRWLITGAAGRIGVALRRHLTDRGIALRSVDLATPQAVSEDDEVMTVDLRDLDAMTRSAEGCDGIVHLGGLSDEADFHDLAEVNTPQTQWSILPCQSDPMGSTASPRSLVKLSADSMQTSSNFSL